MPYRYIHEDAPKDMSLPVLTELPDGIVDRHAGQRYRIGPQEASGYVGDDYKTYHFDERKKRRIKVEPRPVSNETEVKA